MMYQRMVDLAEKSNAEIAVCGVLTEYDSIYDTVIRYEYKKDNVIEGKTALALLTRQYHQDISISAIPCNKIYRNKFIKDNKYYFLSNNYNDDDVFNFICFLNANKVAIASNTYYHYYQRKNSIMHVFSKKKIDDLIDAFIIIKKYLDDNNIYELYQDIYYSYFEKSLASVLNILITSEADTIKQNEHINYLLTKCKKVLILSEYINYIGLQRIKRFLTPR